jgi:hypothetical protein
MQPVSGKEQHTSTQFYCLLPMLSAKRRGSIPLLQIYPLSQLKNKGLSLLQQYFYESEMLPEETILNQILQYNDELLRIWNDNLNQTIERSHH